MVKKNLVGCIFGRLKVIEYIESRDQKRYWKCVCECGNIVESYTAALNYGLIKSCGCLRAEAAKVNGLKGAKACITHGCTNTSEYKTWTMMKSRCNNPKSSSYEDYGGRGIKLCERWNESFQNFIDDMGMKPSPHSSIDRIDVNCGYYKENCRWANTKEQQTNKRSNVYIEFKGEVKTLSEWAKIIGINHMSLKKRMKSMPLEKALTMKKQCVGRSRKLTKANNLDSAVTNLINIVRQIGKNCILKNFGEIGDDFLNAIKELIYYQSTETLAA